MRAVEEKAHHHSHHTPRRCSDDKKRRSRAFGCILSSSVFPPFFLALPSQLPGFSHPPRLEADRGLHAPGGAGVPPAPVPVQVLPEVGGGGHRPRWDRHIRRWGNDIRRPRRLDDRRSTSIRRQTTNNRTVQNDIRRDANVRLPRTGVRWGMASVMGKVWSCPGSPLRLVGLQRVPAQLCHAAQVRPLDGRRRPQGARLRSAPSAARLTPLLADAVCLLFRHRRQRG